MPSRTVQKPSNSPSKLGLKPEKKKPSSKGSTRQTSERKVHMLAWQWIKKTYPDLLIFHVPSGEPRDVVVAMKLKRMGVVPGVADFLMFVPGYNIAIEMKEDSGRQSDAQKRFQKQWEACGNVYQVARSLTDFQNIVNTYVWPWSLKQSASMPHPS
jgi:hypothetical protein